MFLSPPLFGQPATPAEKAVHITLHPMPLPQPALQYQLLPPLLDRRPGNAAVWWNRIPADRGTLFNDFYKRGGTWDKIGQWMEIPLGDPREKRSARKIRRFATGLAATADTFATWPCAARFESCDWQLPIPRGQRRLR